VFIVKLAGIDSMYILGISAFYHDSAAALLKDGKLIAAASEERFTRKKHDERFPFHAIDFCLSAEKISIKNIDYVAFYDKPFVKFERLLLTYLSYFPRGIKSFLTAMPVWLKRKLWTKTIIQKELGFDKEILFCDHHLSHAASAFLVSPFDEAAILTMDGVGEWSTATRGMGKGLDITLFHEIRFPHSLGLLYSAFTYYLGFKVNSAEYKVMGLAPYGKPTYYDKVRELVDIRDDGSFVLNMKYFEYPYGLKMTNGHFDRLFGGPPRVPESRLTQREFDIAASIQKVTDEIMSKAADHLYKETGLKNLCLAGGVALNCVANGKVLRETPFENLFVQPAAGDAGGALGAAFYLYNTVLRNPRSFVMEDAYYGPEYSRDEIKEFLDTHGIPYSELTPEVMVRRIAELIDEQHVVGWFQGRMEFGPRALGSRSILADPRNPKMKDILNLKIKFREGFRPFAPTVLEERVGDYFEFTGSSPFMLLVAQVREDKRVIPSVTHVDGSARLQTISRQSNPLYYDLIGEFEKRTGLPVIINTSFNVRGEPIVCTPLDAYRCFVRTKMDELVMGPFLLSKTDKHPEIPELLKGAKLERD
jgi:carbamoyltransferase